jgi:hypothetical protein
MKRLFAFVILAFSAAANSQAVRWDWFAFSGNPSATSSPKPGVYIPIMGISNATINICTSPANAVPCTNYATTYTDSSGVTPCPTSPTAAQLTRPGSAICVSAADSQGNFGAWLNTGTYQYTISFSSGSYGPFDFSIAVPTSSQVSGQVPGNIPLATGTAFIGAASHLTDNGSTINSSIPLSITGCTSGQLIKGDGTGCVTPVNSGTVTGQANGVIPLATGATTIGSQSHLDDGVTNANIITASRGVYANVNKVISVIAPPYNAKCDGVTDDQTAIQAAFDAAYSGGLQIQFPAGVCLTSTIVWKGQHFFGAGIGRTIINGKPGQDVFQTPDNNSWSMVEAPTVHDLTIGVDASVNAAATAAGGNNTFPKRVGGTVQGLTPFTTVPIAPGQWAIGADGCSGKGFNTTASSTTVSLTLCALAYQFGSMDPALTTNVPITITNGNGAGSDYTGTISGILSGCTGGVTCQFTVTPAPTGTVTNATGLMLNAPTPPWYFGNAGFALQCSDGANCVGNAISMNFTNLKFVAINAGGKLALNHATGIFTQLAPYASHFKSILFFQLYGGYIEVPFIYGKNSHPRYI